VRVIFPVACDLDRDTDGRVIVGRETAIACDRALKLHHKARQSGIESIIVITAGKASQRWDRAWMAQVMELYILSLDPSATVLVSEAESFNTWGEMQKLAELCLRYRATEVVLAVKWWHASRSKFLCRHWLKRFGLAGMPLSVSRCHSHASFRAIAKEFLGAWPKNLYRVIRHR
jgi:hypothetical protein